MKNERKKVPFLQEKLSKRFFAFSARHVSVEDAIRITMSCERRLYGIQKRFLNIKIQFKELINVMKQ